VLPVSTTRAHVGPREARGGPDAPQVAGSQQSRPQKDERPTAAGPACVFISNGIQYFFNKEPYFFLKV